MPSSLYGYVISRVQPEVVFGAYSGQNISFQGTNDVTIWCPFHNKVIPPELGHAPSFSINVHGPFYCHSCQAKGRDIVAFYEKLFDVTAEQALIALYAKFIEPVISDSMVEILHKNLMACPSMVNWLLKVKGLNKQTLVTHRLGFDNSRVTIPIPNEFGLTVDMLRYDYTKSKGPKVLPYKKGFGHARLFPIRNLTYKNILLCEGWTDALLATQRGYHAITTTGGVGVWKDDWIARFADKNVVICYDVNDKHNTGQIAARKRAKLLSSATRSVRVVILPLRKRGGDLVDYFHEGKHTRADFDKLIKQTLPAKRVVRKISELVPFIEITDPTYYHKAFRFNAAISGQSSAPYGIPRKVKIRCTAKKQTERCNACRLKPGTEQIFELNPTAVNILRLINIQDKAKNSYIRTILGISSRCSIAVEIIAIDNLWELLLTPSLSRETYEEQTTINRRAFCSTPVVRPGQTYEFAATNVVHPTSQKLIHLLKDPKKHRTDLDSFVLDEAMYETLSIFKPPSGEPQNIMQFLASMYDELAINATRIFERPGLHQAVDLVFHSPLTFVFNGEPVRRGWLNCLIFGDTRTGKGYVAEGLSRYYGVGEVVSGENSSFAGLVAGVQQAQNQAWFITWGRLPMNDRRLVIIDELSAMSINEFERLSRVRSEGLVEISKIQAGHALARTRLVCLSNPRFGKALRDFSYGVLAIPDLIGRAEDVARFDYAFSVASEEVSASTINRMAPSRVHSRFTKQACNALIRWVWSRTSLQVQFTGAATKRILKYSNELGMVFSPVIPLIQAEDIRIKLARLSAAVAGRIFSHAQNGEILQVREGSVEVAKAFLERSYKKPSMGYYEYSQQERQRQALIRPPELAAKIQSVGPYAARVVDYLLHINQFTFEDIVAHMDYDWTGARKLISALITHAAVTKQRGVFTGTASLVQLLRRMKEGKI